MKKGDKVFVSDWGKEYRDIYRMSGSMKQVIWGWETPIPKHCGTMFHWDYKYEPNLTLKGTVNKREPQKFVSKTPKYLNYEYTIVEITVHPNGQLIYLLSSEEGCWVQIGEGGISTLTPEEQERVKHLESTKSLQALAKNNLGKWSIDMELKEFPKELLKYLYDTDQATCFGSDWPTTKAIIRYPYICKEYTVNGNDICLGWTQEYNGVGCDLTDKDTISWHELPKRFPENGFG